MSHIEVIRYWKNEEYRSSLSAAQRGTLPDHPAGPMDLLDDELDLVGGNNGPTVITVDCGNGSLEVGFCLIPTLAFVNCPFPLPFPILPTV